MKTALMIDGGYLRARAKASGLAYDNDLIRRFANSCYAEDERQFRTFYYDSPPFKGKVKLPVSGKKMDYPGLADWLDELSREERFAVRRGTVGFRGWSPRKIPVTGRDLEDRDFRPVFEQKGVDMRIGLDIASFCELRSVERVLLVSGDTDMIPAMKHARKAGLEVGMMELPEAEHTKPLHYSLLTHCDFTRKVAWPFSS